MDPQRVKLNESRILVNGFQNSTGEIKTRRNVLVNQMESHGTHQHQPLIAQFLKKRKVDTQQTGSSVCDGRTTPGISKGDRYERHNAPAECFKNVVTEAILGGNSNDSEMNNGCNEVDQPMSGAALAESLSNIVDASCSDDITGQIEANRTESSTHQGYSLETVDIISDEEKQADYSSCNTVHVVFVKDSTVHSTAVTEQTQNKLLTTKRKMKKSAICFHFKKTPMLNTSECNYCHKTLQTSNATNVKRHLRNCKPEAYKDVEDADKPLNSSRISKYKPLTKASFSKFYERNHPKQVLFRKKLVFLAGGTTIAKLILQTPAFKDCIFVADPKLRVPNYNTVNSDIKKLVLTSKNQIRDVIKTVKRMTVSSDIWTKRGQGSSYLGVIATFFYEKLQKKVQVVLSVRKFQSVSHKADDIIREMKYVMSDFDIQPDQVWRSMTDGASNMISSHLLRSKLFTEKTTNARFEELNADIEDIIEYGSDECLSEPEMLEEISICEGSLNVNDQPIDNEEKGSYRRLGCFIYTLLRCLCVCELSENAKKIQPIITKVKFVVEIFKKSHNLTELLIKKTGVGLISFSETRWNYIYNVFTRILRVKLELIDTLVECKKDKEKYLLTEAEWKDAEKLANFLKPFNDYTNTNSQETEAVSSEVVVTILQLYTHLDKYEHDPLLDDFGAAIKQKMKEKFSHWFHDNPNQPIEGTYLSATLLDPRYRVILPNDQRNLAKLSIIREYGALSAEDSAQFEPLSSPISENDSSSKICRFPILSEIKSCVLRARSATPQAGIDQFKAELNKFLESGSFDELDENLDVFKFWIELRERFPLLAPIALDYLSIPSSTANVECMFSTAGILSSRRGYNLDGENLEDEVLLSKNKCLLEEISKHQQSEQAL